MAADELEIFDQPVFSDHYREFNHAFKSSLPGPFRVLGRDLLNHVRLRHFAADPDHSRPDTVSVPRGF